MKRMDKREQVHKWWASIPLLTDPVCDNIIRTMATDDSYYAVSTIVKPDRRKENEIR